MASSGWKTSDKPYIMLPYVVSIADGPVAVVRVDKEVAYVDHASWSPDGKRIAFEWKERITAPGTPDGSTASRVTVSDSDGGNAKVIIRREVDRWIRGLDWK